MPGAFLHPFAKPTREKFITVARGEGALLWDVDGHEMVDAMASLWYCQIGHGRSEVAEAVSRQISTIAAYSCFDPFTNAPADALAERIAELAPIQDARVFFTGSGSEAVDSAMKLARLAHVRAGHPERRVIISRERGYHGTNYGGTSAQGIAANRDGYGELLADVVQVPSDDIEALSVLMAERSRRDRRGHHRAHPGCCRRLPTARGLPRRGPATVRSPWCVAHLRRGDHRFRASRYLVRR